MTVYDTLAGLENLLGRDLVRTGTLGSDNDFSACKQRFDHLREQVAHLRRMDPFPPVPEGNTRDLEKSAGNLAAVLKETLKYTAEQGQQPRNKLIEDFHGHDRDFFGRAQQFLFFGDTARVHSALGDAKRLLGQVEKVQQENAELLQEITRVSEKTVFKEHEEVYRTEAKHSSIWSFAWIGLAVLTAYLALDFGLSIVGVKEPFLLGIGRLFSGLPNVTSYPGVAARVAVFSIFYFGLVWCGRNFRASRHSHTVNRERFNALRTLNLVLETVREEDRKDVLLQSLALIQAGRPSGFLAGDKERAGESLADILKGYRGSG